MYQGKLMETAMTSDSAKLPLKGRKKKEILKELKACTAGDPEYKDLKTWSLVYYLGEEHTNFLHDAYGILLSANGLNPMAFQSLKKLETNVIRITANLLNGDKNVCGVMTSGGTESCLLAVKTYRDMARAKRPWIRKPNMIIPVTAHVAWQKAAEYFNVKAIYAPLNENYFVDTKAVKKSINRNTIMLLGGAPEYPHGIIDPIEELGEIAEKKTFPSMWMHVWGDIYFPLLKSWEINSHPGTSGCPESPLFLRIPTNTVLPQRGPQRFSTGIPITCSTSSLSAMTGPAGFSLPCTSRYTSRRRIRSGMGGPAGHRRRGLS